MVARLVVLHGDRGNPVDGIRDHTRCLAEALARHPVEVAISSDERRHGARAWVRTFRGLRRLGRDSAVVLQYMPFCFATWGFAPWLPLYLLALRGGQERPTIVLMVHEPYVPMLSWRWMLMGIWQRAQLTALRLAADVVFTSIEPWAEMLSARPPWQPVHHLPVGSNFPDRRSAREESRRQLGIGDGTLLVAAMGRDHPSWRGEYVVAVMNLLAGQGRSVALLLLGADAPALSGLDRQIAVHRPGYLDDADLAAHAAAADLFLAPLLDGVSSRRGTLMVALQHGLPVVGTVGPLTDPSLADEGEALCLRPIGEVEAFAQAAVELAGDEEARVAVGAAARGLYERCFSWPIIAAQLTATLADRERL